MKHNIEDYFDKNPTYCKVCGSLMFNHIDGYKKCGNCGRRKYKRHVKN